MSTGPHDRASVVTTTLLALITEALQGGQLRQRIEDVLRDEFADLEREIADHELSG